MADDQAAGCLAPSGDNNQASASGGAAEDAWNAVF